MVRPLQQAIGLIAAAAARPAMVDCLGMNQEGQPMVVFIHI